MSRALPVYTTAETEVIFLHAVQELTTEMANLDMIDASSGGKDLTVRFRDSARSRLFFIWLVDFVSPSDPMAAGEKITYLSALERIGQAPSFNSANSVAHLQSIVTTFKKWLETEFSLPIWLPSLDIETNLTFTRLQAIRFSGNVLKHNLTRLAQNTRAVIAALKVAGHEVTIQEALLATEDFQMSLYDDVLGYHTSTLVWYINEIRWGIHLYLSPEYRRSHVLHEDGCRYHYTYPSTITNTFAQRSYWELMNGVRSGPIVPRFTVTEWLQKRL